MGSEGGLWSHFEHDPRDPAYAGMRASDRDRGVVHDALAEAYAQGRIDREELDERTTQVDLAKTYGDLLAPLRDLAADARALTTPPTTAADIQRRARGHFRQEFNEALFGFLVPNLICWSIFVLGQHGSGFAWPIFVLVPTLINVLRVASNRQSIIEKRIEKLERQRTAALEPPKPTSANGED